MLLPRWREMMRRASPPSPLNSTHIPRRAARSRLNATRTNSPGAPTIQCPTSHPTRSGRPPRVARRPGREPLRQSTRTCSATLSTRRSSCRCRRRHRDRDKGQDRTDSPSSMPVRPSSRRWWPRPAVVSPYILPLWSSWPGHPRCRGRCSSSNLPTAAAGCAPLQPGWSQMGRWPRCARRGAGFSTTSASMTSITRGALTAMTAAPPP